MSSKIGQKKRAFFFYLYHCIGVKAAWEYLLDLLGFKPTKFKETKNIKDAAIYSNLLDGFMIIISSRWIFECSKWNMSTPTRPTS